MTVLFLSFNGDPRGKGDPRAVVRGRFATLYKAEKDRSYESSVATIAKAYMIERGLEPLTGPISVTMIFRLAIPPSTPKWLTAKYLSGEEAYLGQFDLDNMMKSIGDGLNKVCFEDDRQIVRAWLEKKAAPSAGIDVRIEALKPQPQP